MTESPFPDTEDLLAQMGWVRRLATKLVADPNQVEDVVQDTMTVALSQRPSGGTPVRRWLAGVVRNLVRQDRRTSERRAARERSAARGEREPGPGELVERWALHRQLVDSVEGLDEPYREALLMRYFEGLPPREMARRLGLPVKTVKTRLARALDRLRARLAVRYERDGRDWLAALLPLTQLPAPQTALAATTLGALAMNTKLLACLLALVIGGSMAGVYWMGAEPAEADGVATSSPVPRARAGESGVELAVAEDPARRVVQVAADRTAAASPAEEDRETPSAAVVRAVSGRAFDGEARAVAGVELAWLSGEPVRPDAGAGSGDVVRTDAAGAFSFETDRTGMVESGSSEWVTVLSGSVRPDSEIEPVLVVAPAIQLGGRVIDEAGRPLADANVRVVLPVGFEARFSRPLEGSQRSGWFCRTDENGRFEFDAAPRVLESTLRADAEGYRTSVVPAPDGSADALVIVLERHVAREGQLRGEVIDDAGRRVEGARVALGVFSTLTDENGQFGVDIDLAVATERLYAVKVGHQAGSLERPGDPQGPNGGWPDYVVVELGGPPLSITGRVLGYDGKPLAGVQVWVHDPSCFGLLGGAPAMLENLIAGVGVRGRGGPDNEALARMVRRGGYLDLDDVPEEPNVSWGWIDTDARGQFVLPGLMPREYTVRALDPDTLVMREIEGVRAGATGVEVDLSTAGIRKVVDGRVVSRGGQPLAGVRVRAVCVPVDTRLQIAETTFDSRCLRMGGATTTDSEGRFRFENLPRDGVAFSLRGDSILPDRVEPERDEMRGELRITATAKCLVDVVLEDPESADRIEFQDADGNGVDIFVIRNDAIEAITDYALVDGRSGVVAVAEGVTKLVLTKGGELVDTHDIAPVPGEVLEIRP